MQEKILSYSLNFEGYWRDINKGGLPTYSGIYTVYRCRYNDDVDTVSLIEIIYIGQAENIRDRHKNHEKLELFKTQLKSEEELCYSCTQVDKGSLDLVENALVFAQKPRLNDQLREKYNHQPARFKLDGMVALMKYTDFSIE